MDQQNILDAINPSVFDSDSRYVNLGHIYRTETVGENFWVDIFAGLARELLDITSEMADHLTTEKVMQYVDDEYRVDPLLGLSAALDKPHMVPFVSETVMINGKNCPGILDIIQFLPNLLINEKILFPAPYTRIPGNLSINHMEFDLQEKELHILGRKKNRPFGDLKHDLARFAFTLEGGVTSLVMKLDGMQGVKVSGFESNQQRMVNSMFKRWLNRLNPDLVRQIPFIMALDCFALLNDTSIEPLKQQAILARGLLGIQPYIQDMMATDRHIAI